MLTKFRPIKVRGKKMTTIGFPFAAANDSVNKQTKRLVEVVQRQKSLASVDVCDALSKSNEGAKRRHSR